jgi:hypothetical protein
MNNVTLGRTPRRAVATAGAAPAAVLLLPGAAFASPTTSLCRTAGDPASPAEIMGQTDADLAHVQTELHMLQREYDSASTASPAAWRLREELDRLDGKARALQDLHATAFIRSDATPGSAAQFRAQEELDALCASLG